MAFLDDLYIIDPLFTETSGKLYKVENDVVNTEKSLLVNKGARGVLVCQNQADVYTVNREHNSITRIRDGVSLGDIAVGRMPYGICEDIDGVIYVTNYADNTVSVIENGVVTQTIPVIGGPRGIVADYYGNIWVACYLTNTVARITNKVLVDEIIVAYNPEGITCSPTNDIWVTCSGSNCVVKIARGKKDLTIDVGRCPVAVVSDKKGNVFTANYIDDTVTMISTSDGYQTTAIRVGDGPSSIAINSEGSIYVLSSLSSELVYKINPAVLGTQDALKTMPVCKSQSAFADFTGCAAYNVFHPFGDGASSSVITGMVGALKPLFKVTDIEEGLNYEFKLSSDLLDLENFDELKLNTILPDSNGKFTLTPEQTGTSLDLVGKFNASEPDTTAIPFIPVLLKGVFKAYVGVVDNNYLNYTKLAEKVIDFNNKDVVNTFVKQTVSGHMVVLVPTRVLSETDFTDGFMVQGSFNIADNWKKTIPDTENEGTTLSEEQTKTKIFEQISDWADAKKEKYSILINNYQTNTNEKWMFNFFKTF